MEGTYWLYVNRRPATSVLALFMSPWYTLWGEEEQPLSHVAYTDHVNASRGIVVFYGETRLFFIQLRRISRLINDPLSKTPPGLPFNPPSFLFVAEGATGGSFPCDLEDGIFQFFHIAFISSRNKIRLVCTTHIFHPSRLFIKSLGQRISRPVSSTLSYPVISFRYLYTCVCVCVDLNVPREKRADN